MQELVTQVLQQVKGGLFLIKKYIMWFKCLDEEGNYISSVDGSPKNLLISEYALYTPEGINVGWTEFTHISDAMVYFKIFPKPISDEV